MWVARGAVLLAALGVTPLLASPDLFNRAETCEGSVSTVTIEPSARTVTVTVGETSAGTSASASVTATATATATSSTPSVSTQSENSGTFTPRRSSTGKTGSAASGTPKVSPSTPSQVSSETSSDTKSDSASSGGTSTGGTSSSVPSSGTASGSTSTRPSSGTRPKTHASDVIIGSQTVPIQSTPTTITQSGEPIVVGPSGIQIGSETLKSATTMTADGVTVTYDGPEEDTATSSAATTSGAAATATASSSSMAWAGYITINDQTYHIPSDDSPLDIVLDDGSLLTLSSGQVSINGDKVNIPDNVSDSPTLTADGQSFTVGEGFDGDGSDGGGDGGSGGSGGSGGGGGGSGISSLIDTLSGLGDTESSLSSSLDKITSGIKSWASGGSEASSLSGSIDSALENLNQVLSPMRSISQSTELQELTTDGLRVVSNAYPELERGRDILSSMQKLLKGLPTLRDAATQNVKKYWLRYVATGGGLLALDQSIQKLKDYSWDDALVATKTATSTTASETKATSATSTTSTESPTASSYFITTKRGTSLTKFKTFVHGLDGGAGTQIAYSEVDHQGYVTDLTVTQLATVKALPFIRTVSYNIPVTELEDDEDFRAVPNRASSPEFDELHDVTNQKSSKLLSSRAITQSPRSNSGSHLKMISSDKTGKPTEDYLFDDTLGKGTTIYVIDTGYDLSKPDLASAGRKVDTYVVPNALTLNGVPTNQQKPEDLTDWGRHGTSVASVAGGVIRGVASNADLYLVKYKSAYDRTTNGATNLVRKNAPLPAVEDAFQNVLQHIRKNSNQGKAVVNMSWGSKVSAPDYAARKQSLEDFISELEQLDVVVVIAAGNENKEKLEERIPQAMGTDINSIITVGGVDEDGQIWEHSTSQGSGGGSLSVFAQSKNLEMDVPFVGVRKIDGTSFAAPAVAGLAAYYLGIPDTKKLFTTGSVSTMVKSYIKKTSFQRVQTISNSNTPAGYNFPSNLNVAYNLARGNPPNCGSGKILPRGESDDACPVASSSTSGSPTSSSHKSTATSSSKSGISTRSSTPRPVTTATPTSAINGKTTGSGTATTGTGTATTSTGTPSSTGKLTCKGGDGPTISLSSLNNHTENGVATEGGIAHWCDNFLFQFHDHVPETFEEAWDTALMNATVQVDDCPNPRLIPYNDCLDWWGEIANGCDTDSGDKHGGTYEIGCITIELNLSGDDS